MGKQRRLKFDDLERRAWEIVADWAEKWRDKPLPVPLEELAAAYKVRRLEYQPLLTTAGLEQEEDGFVVCLNTEADGANQRDGTALELSQMVCAGLKQQLRFTLAHELAHLLLLQIADNKIKQVEVFSDEDTTDDKLEPLCNRLAGAILLPKARLLRELGDQLFDAAVVRRILRDFRVSPEVFFSRLRAPDLRSADLKPASDELDGVVAILRRFDGEDCFVSANFVRGFRATERWRAVAGNWEKLPLQSLHLKPEVLQQVLTLPEYCESTTVIWRSDTKTVLPCKLTSYRLYPSPLGVIVGIQVMGEPELASI